MHNQVFDVTRKVTYQNLANWYKELREYCENIPCFLVANKIDVDMNVSEPVVASIKIECLLSAHAVLLLGNKLGYQQKVQIRRDAQPRVQFCLRRGRYECGQGIQRRS